MLQLEPTMLIAGIDLGLPAQKARAQSIAPLPPSIELYVDFLAIEFADNFYTNFRSLHKIVNERIRNKRLGIIDWILRKRTDPAKNFSLTESLMSL